MNISPIDITESELTAEAGSAPEGDLPALEPTLAIELNTKDLTRAIRVCSALTPHSRRPSLPILEHVYLSYSANDSGTLHVRRCDLETFADVAIDAHLVDGQFSGVATCLSTHELGAVLKGMRATTIQLRLGGKRVQLETPHGLTWLSTMDPTDYPSWDILIQKLPLPRDEQVGWTRPHDR